MKQTKSKIEIQTLKEEFEQTNSILNKIDFWEKRLDCIYIHKELLLNNDFRFENFEIIPQNPDEIELLNLKCLELTIKSKRKSRNQPIDSNTLINNYQRDIIQVNDKEAFKRSTLEWIHDILKEKGNPKLLIEEERNEYFLKAYEDYIFDSIEPDYTNEVIEFDIAYEINNGFELAKFHEYVVKGKLQSPKNITPSLQILLLDYLGVGKNISNSTKKAELYSKILDKPQESTEKKLDKIEDSKTLENLNYLRKVFMEVGLTEQLQLIEIELRNLLK